MSVELVASGGNGLTGPTFNAQTNTLHVTSTASGDVLQLGEDGSLKTVFTTGGAPSAVSFDSEGGALACDLAHQCILRRTPAGELSSLATEYEAQGFKGPSAIAVDSKANIFFCDSGPLGETTLSKPEGSVFCISSEGSLLLPLVHQSLAHPCALALSPSEEVIYVAEMLSNRILRLTQAPKGVFHCSVFYQCAGGVGPSGIACDSKGNLYVSRYEVSGADATGLVSVLSSSGKLISEVVLPAPELTGIVIDPSGAFLYVTENSTSSVYRFGAL